MTNHNEQFSVSGRSQQQLMNIVIIGGGTAGLAVATELRKIDKKIGITIIEQSKDIGYSPCSLPYLLSGEVKEKDIFYTSKKDLEENGIKVVKASVQKIDTARKIVFCGDEIRYDKLVIATGSVPNYPPIKGIENGIALRSVGDAKKIMSNGKVVVIGGGLAGVEIAVALSKRGVTILEAAGRLLPGMLDNDVSAMLKESLAKKGISVKTGCNISEIEAGTIRCNETLKFDTLVVATGVKPNKTIAEAAKLKCGIGIVVDQNMRTSDKNIYACGECAEVRHFLSGKPYVSQSGVSAVQQALVVARSINGVKVKPNIHVDSAVSVIGEGLFFGAAGVTEERARSMGKVISATFTGNDKSDYFPTAKKVTVKVIADMKGRLIGCQALAETNISDLINMASLAITKGMTLQDVIETETCYNPAVAGINHPLTMAAYMASRKLEHER